MSNTPAIAVIRSSQNRNVFFARHESFHPRHGWLKKGFEAVLAKPDIFVLPDSHLELGVGKNMGQSIRYWTSAFRLIEPAERNKMRVYNYNPTDFGLKLMSDSGWDPWLEDPASLWLLHWNLLKEPCFATAWNIFFNAFRKVEFSAEDIQLELARFRNQHGLNISDSSLNKDAQCILRMYTEQREPKQISDENIDCPFVELKLVQKSGDPKLHQFRQGTKSNLPSSIIVAAALEYVFSLSPAQKTISISNLTYGTGSPGLIFKLPESSVYSAVEDVSGKFDDISISDMAGALQMSFNGDPLILANEILNDYYDR